MNDALGLALAVVMGVFLGALFFAGLWWTVRKGISSPRPAPWFFGSMLVRTGLALVGFYWIARDHWERVLPCLLGFVAARAIVTWRIRPFAELPSRPAQEKSHAP